MKLSFNKKKYTNRKEKPLPDTKAIIEIVYNDGERKYLCKWTPRDLNDKTGDPRCLGTALEIKDDVKYGRSFLAWDESESEFIYYKIIAFINN